MKTETILIEDIIDDQAEAKKAGANSIYPPIDWICNNMGINLCSVHSITRTRQDDGQYVALTVNFIPGTKCAEDEFDREHREWMEEFEAELVDKTCKTWREWNDLLDAGICDPDGFRDNDSNKLYTKEGFKTRLVQCTVNMRSGYYQLIDEAEACELLKMSNASFKRLLGHNLINPPVQTSEGERYSKGDILAYIKS